MSWPPEAIVRGREVRTANAVARKRDLIEDVEWILTADDPAIALRRLGYDKPGSLAKRLLRAGRPDLARPFWALDNAQRWATHTREAAA